jgi:hypothetical protein
MLDERGNEKFTDASAFSPQAAATPCRIRVQGVARLWLFVAGPYKGNIGATEQYRICSGVPRDSVQQLCQG